MKDNYDIIIVGAGPAGSTTAEAAVKGGADVLMIDKRRELGVPVQCGEALTEEVLEELNIKPDSRWALNKINGAKLVSPSGKPVTIKQNKAAKIGYILDRKVFDKYLATRAVRAGADIKTGTFVDGLVKNEGRIKGVTVKPSENGRKIHADMVIAADGVMSRVGRWAGFDTKLGMEDIESGSQFKMINVDVGEKSVMKFYFGSDIAPGGYCWVFPLGEDEANVGIGVSPERAEKKSIEYLEDFVSNKPELKNGKIMEINVGGVPVCGPLEKTYDDDILLVGDAARQVNSMTGGGIDWSMRAGNIAGRVAAEAIADGDTSADRLKEYEDEWRDLIGEDLEKYFEGKEVLMDLSDDELDEVADAMQDVDFEEISLTDMLKVLVKVNPKLIFKLRGFL